MLFKQEDLAATYDSISEAANILNEAVYLTEDESFLSPVAVPVVENARIGAGVVQFNDVERLAEENGIDYLDAMEAIAEANDVDTNRLAVAVDEWKVIESPEIVNELANVVLKPMSPYDPIGLFTEACVDLFVESGDYGFLDCLLETITWDKAGLQKAATVFSSGKTAARFSDMANRYLSLKAKGKDKKANNLKAGMERLYNAATNSGTSHSSATYGFEKGSGNDLTQSGTKVAGGRKADDEHKIDAMQAQIDQVKEKQDLAAQMAAGRMKGANNSASDSANSAEAAKADVKQTRSFLQSVKHYTIDTPRDAIAKAINKLREKYQSFERVKNANAADPQKKTIFQKILSAISSVLDKLTNLLTRKKD